MTRRLPYIRHPIFALISLMCFAAMTGCEGATRQHDDQVADISKPKPYAEPLPHEREAPADVNYPDLVEAMLEKRQAYVNSIMELERAYLNGGDSDRANWARSQRAQVERVENYPYLTKKTAEYSPQAAPEESSTEADQLYHKGLSILNTFRRVPLAGVLPANKNKAREALALFKRVLDEHPKSDKVDDAAFWCGEIYKEYLREEDPNDELSVRYYQWAFELDPQTPHPARFQCAVVYDFRKHDRARAIELYHDVMEKETDNSSNVRFSATRVEQLTDEEHSHVRPRDRDVRDTAGEPPSTDIDETAPVVEPDAHSDETVMTGGTPDDSRAAPPARSAYPRRASTPATDSGTSNPRTTAGSATADDGRMEVEYLP